MDVWTHENKAHIPEAVSETYLAALEAISEAWSRDLVGSVRRHVGCLVGVRLGTILGAVKTGAGLVTQLLGSGLGIPRLNGTSGLVAQTGELLGALLGGGLLRVWSQPVLVQYRQGLQCCTVRPTSPVPGHPGLFACEDIR
ncbi:MAG: hypothetical protein Q9170_001657 [Blastenia crenularia]